MHKPIARIISWNEHGLDLCASAAKISSTLGNADEVFRASIGNPKNISLIQNVVKMGHQSVIEHAVFSIEFWDVSVFVEQFLIEFRLASFTVKSRRFVDFSQQGYYVPEDLSETSRETYNRYMRILFDAYHDLMDIGILKEDARFLLPYAFCSNLYCTINARELIHMISSMLYGHGSRYPEIKKLGYQLAEQLSELFPVFSFELIQTEKDVGQPTYCFRRDEKEINYLRPEEVGQVHLLQQPVDAVDILQKSTMVSHGSQCNEVRLKTFVTQTRSRELEQLSYSFSIHGISLSGITHLVRHRMQSILIPPIETVDHSRVILPESIEDNAEAKQRYERAIQETHGMIDNILDDPMLSKYSYYFSLSGNLMDVLTTINARELLLLIQLRSCNRAQWEIRRIAIQMLSLLRKSCPALFQYYGPSCFVNGYCPEGKKTCGRMNEVVNYFRTKNMESE